MNDQSLLSEKQLARMVHKIQLLRELRESGKSAYQFARERGINPSTLYKDTKRERFGPAALTDGRSRNGRKRQLTDEALTWVLAFLATNRRASLSSAHRALVAECPRLGWRTPSYGQVCRAVCALPPDARELMVHGGRHHFEQWGLVRRVEVDAPNTKWQVDATEMPVWALDLTTGEQFKPWGIGFIDCASRVVLGLSLLRVEPSTSDLLLALRRAILPKQDERFPFFGRPQKLGCDNGSIFKSGDFLDALLRLGIERDEIPNNCPAANGKIERVFRTVQDGLCRELTQYANQHRGLAAARRSPLPFPILSQLADRFLVEYHLRSHRALNATPFEVWHDRLDRAIGFDIDADGVVDACRLRIEKRVGRDGVEMGVGCHFSAPELAGLVGRTVTLRVLPEGGDTEILCFYNGQLVAELRRVEGDAVLGASIKAARLDRAKELARLRKTLLKTAARILPERPSLLPPGAKIITPAPPAEPAEEAAMEIPDLPSEEEDGA